MSDIEFGMTLYKLYHTAVKLEAIDVMDNTNCKDLTVNELNLIECIHSLTKGSEGPTISAIACRLDITRPSTTVAVNKLCGKGIAEKKGSENDGRSVRVYLTKKGESAYNAHRAFQISLTKAAKREFSEEEYRHISDSLTRLENFLQSEAEKVDANAKPGVSKGKRKK